MMDHKKKILLVCSPYYKDITSNLIKGASDFLKSNFVDYRVLNVPGALEIAPAIKLISDKTVKKPIFDGYLALGCVIRGETSHFDIVINESARAITNLSIDNSLIIGNGILTVENKQQAIDRSNDDENNKGYHAALACSKLIDLKGNI